MFVHSLSMYIESQQLSNMDVERLQETMALKSIFITSLFKTSFVVTSPEITWEIVTCYLTPYSNVFHCTNALECNDLKSNKTNYTMDPGIYFLMKTDK